MRACGCLGGRAPVCVCVREVDGNVIFQARTERWARCQPLVLVLSPQDDRPTLDLGNTRTEQRLQRPSAPSVGGQNKPFSVLSPGPDLFLAPLPIPYAPTPPQERHSSLVNGLDPGSTPAGTCLFCFVFLFCGFDHRTRHVHVPQHRPHVAKLISTCDANCRPFPEGPERASQARLASRGIAAQRCKGIRVGRGPVPSHSPHDAHSPATTRTFRQGEGRQRGSQKQTGELRAQRGQSAVASSGCL